MSVAAHTVILTQILLAVFFRFQKLSHVCPFESAAMMRILKQQRAEKQGLGYSNATRTAVHPLIWDQSGASYLLNMLIAHWFSVCGDVMHLESNRQLTGRDNCTNDAVLLLQMGRTVLHTAQVKLLPVGFPLLHHLVFSSCDYYRKISFTSF